MADTPAADPAGNEKVKLGKKGMLTGKNKWYVIGGLGILAVLVFFFVSRSNSNAAPGTATTTGTSMDPATQAALQSALQGQSAAGYAYQASTGPQGVEGPTGPQGKTGKTGPRGKTGKKAPKPKNVPPRRGPVHNRPGKTQFYMVRPGDTLSKIASSHHVSGGWHSLYSMNRNVVGSNPNVIHPGQRLKL